MFYTTLAYAPVSLRRVRYRVCGHVYPVKPTTSAGNNIADDACSSFASPPQSRVTLMFGFLLCPIIKGHDRSINIEATSPRKVRDAKRASTAVVYST